MDNKNFRDAFDPVRPSEEVKRNILNMAADRGKQPGKLRRAAIRVAAVAAAVAIFVTAMLWPRKTEDGIVTAPGVLKVYAYDITTGTDIHNMVSYELTESVVADTRAWTPIMNSLYGLPLTLKVEDPNYSNMDVAFDVSVSHGGFYGDIHSSKYKKEDEVVASLDEVDFGSEFTVDNGETIFWNCPDLFDEAADKNINFYDLIEEIGSIQVRITVRADSNIVGYGVLEIKSEEVGWFTASVVETVKFPQVNGAFQNVTADYVWQKIDESKLG